MFLVLIYCNHITVSYCNFVGYWSSGRSIVVASWSTALWIL